MIHNLKHKTMENVFKTFNKDFFKSVKDITWFDKQGVLKLDENRLVLITIDDVGTRDSYNGYWVEILNKFNGTIIKRFFKFNDHLTMIHRPGHKACHVWYNNEQFEWYISIPKNPKEMTAVIMDWITMFK